MDLTALADFHPEIYALIYRRFPNLSELGLLLAIFQERVWETSFELDSLDDFRRLIPQLIRWIRHFHQDPQRQEQAYLLLQALLKLALTEISEPIVSEEEYFLFRSTEIKLLNQELNGLHDDQCWANDQCLELFQQISSDCLFCLDYFDC